MMNGGREEEDRNISTSNSPFGTAEGGPEVRVMIRGEVGRGGGGGRGRGRKTTASRRPVRPSPPPLRASPARQPSRDRRRPPGEPRVSLDVRLRYLPSSWKGRAPVWVCGCVCVCVCVCGWLWVGGRPGGWRTGVRGEGRRRRRPLAMARARAARPDGPTTRAAEGGQLSQGGEFKYLPGSSGRAQRHLAPSRPRRALPPPPLPLPPLPSLPFKPQPASPSRPPARHGPSPSLVPPFSPRSGLTSSPPPSGQSAPPSKAVAKSHTVETQHDEMIVRPPPPISPPPRSLAHPDHLLSHAARRPDGLLRQAPGDVLVGPDDPHL